MLKKLVVVVVAQFLAIQIFASCFIIFPSLQSLIYERQITSPGALQGNSVPGIILGTNNRHTLACTICCSLFGVALFFAFFNWKIPKIKHHVLYKCFFVFFFVFFKERIFVLTNVSPLKNSICIHYFIYDLFNFSFMTKTNNWTLILKEQWHRLIMVFDSKKLK